MPFPEILEKRLGMPCVNFGAVNGGIDAFVNDETVLGLCSDADVTVVQIMGAHNMSNRFYSVHPRRNDRFLKASTLMSTIFREVDFTEFAFTRHLLTTLKEASPDKFDVLEQELKAAWMARMKTLLKRIDGKVVLLWITNPSGGDAAEDEQLGTEPLFVDESMVKAVAEHAHDVVQVVVPPEVGRKGTEGMLFPQMEAAAAREMYGPGLHELVADKLYPVLN